MSTTLADIGHGMTTINDVIKARVCASKWSIDDLRRLSYGIRYFDFGATGRRWEPDDIAWWNAEQPLLSAALDALDVIHPQPAAPSPSPADRVQVWESCDECGAQPSYIVGGRTLCERCQPGPQQFAERH